MSLNIFSCIITALALMGCGHFSKDNAERADLHFQIGNSHYANGNYTLALNEFLTAQKLDPKNPVVQNNLGLVYQMKERPDLAEKHLRNALSIKSNYTEARNNLVRLYIDTKKFDLAEKELKIVLDDLTYTSAWKSWFHQGLMRFEQKRWTDAASSFSKALREQRSHCPSASYYGRSLFELGDYRKATEALDSAVEFCQKELFDEPHYYSALSWYRIGDKDRAKARFEEILKLYPDGQYRAKSSAMIEILKKGVQ